MKNKKKFNITKYIPLLIACLLINLVLYLKKQFFDTPFEQLIYGLFRIQGTSFDAVFDGFTFVIIRLIIILPLLLLPVIDFGKKINIKIKKREYQVYPITNIKIYNIVILVLSIIYLFNSSGLFYYVSHIFQKTDLFDNYYVSPTDVDIKFPENKKNLIYIFMESTEATNLSKESGGAFATSIMPNLEKLAQDNINFSNTDLLGGAKSTYGTTWTAAALIAQTSALPLKIKLDDIVDGKMGYENTITIGDILYNNGYTSELMLGSDSRFGGRAEYFQNHHYHISDYYTAIEEKKINKDYHEWWGYEDSKLFSYAKEKLTELASQDKPFNLTLLTADTHFIDGYVDKDCSQDLPSHYANSFNCSDQMINEFINWIYEQDFGKDTVTVISGDHITMQKTFYKDIDKNYTRTTYNVFINTDVTPVNTQNRIFTPFDMYPTTLASLGVTIENNRLGLGTNLFSKEETIAEKLSIDKLNKELSKYSKYYYNKLR